MRPQLASATPSAVAAIQHRLAAKAFSLGPGACLPRQWALDQQVTLKLRYRREDAHGHLAGRACQIDTTQRQAVNTDAAVQSGLYLIAIWPACAVEPTTGRLLPLWYRSAGTGRRTDSGDRTVIRIQKKGPGGLEMLVQHESFVGIYSHFGMVMPAFAEGKRTVAAGEK